MQQGSHGRFIKRGERRGQRLVPGNESGMARVEGAGGKEGRRGKGGKGGEGGREEGRKGRRGEGRTGEDRRRQERTGQDKDGNKELFVNAFRILK